MDKRIPIVWVKDLTDEEKESFVERLRSSDLLDKLRMIVASKIESLREDEMSLKFFEQGAIEKLIFNRGCEAALLDVLRLVTF